MRIDLLRIYGFCYSRHYKGYLYLQIPDFIRRAVRTRITPVTAITSYMCSKVNTQENVWTGCCCSIRRTYPTLPYIQTRREAIVTITFAKPLRKIKVPTASILWRQQLNRGGTEGEQTVLRKTHVSWTRKLEHSVLYLTILSVVRSYTVGDGWMEHWWIDNDRRKTEILGKKPVFVPFYTPQIPSGLVGRRIGSPRCVSAQTVSRPGSVDYKRDFTFVY